MTIDLKPLFSEDLRMQRDQFRIKFSVGTKLLAILVFLMIAVIIALNFSAILVLSRDKQIAVYQQQAAEISTAGKDFVSLVQRNTDVLRLALTNFNPTRPEIWIGKTPALQNVIHNQTDLFLIRIQKLSISQHTLETVLEVQKQETLESLKLSADAVKVMPELITQMVPSLQRNGFSAVNATSLGQPSLIGLTIADLKVPVSEGVYMVATGFVVAPVLLNASQTELTIADRSGWIVFDSNPTVQNQRLSIQNEQRFIKAVSSGLSSGTMDYQNKEGHFLGSFYKPGFDLVVLLKTPWDWAMAPVFSLTENFVFIGLIAIGIAVMCALFFSRTMVSPLNLLYHATKKISQGDFDLNLKVTSQDEMGALTRSFNVMSQEISKLIEDKLKKAHLENELAIASTVQQNLIPLANIDTSHLCIRSDYRPAQQCGGDWWGYFAVGKYACFAVADATGHGLPSALITAAMNSCYSLIEKLFQEKREQPYSPAQILSFANRAIYKSANGQIMMTLFLGVLDLETGILTYSSAGHNPPWVFLKGSDADATASKHKSLIVSGNRLGEAYEVDSFKEKTMQLNEGDILFLYTDGLIEGMNQAGEEYTKKRAMTKASMAATQGPQQIIEVLNVEVRAHNEGKELDDDITYAAIQITKLGSAPA